MTEPPRLADDCFASVDAGPDGAAGTGGGADAGLTPVDDALARLQAGLTPVVSTEHATLWDADGRILAGSAIARKSHPPAANAAVDGYAFAGNALIGAPDVITLPLADGRAAAGAPWSGSLPEGQALRILTGALIPDGADTVIMQEDVATIAPDAPHFPDGAIRFQNRLKQGANCRPAGEDVTAGATLFARGHRLGPQDLAILAATGLAEVEVYAPLKVAVLSTGDEIAAPGTEARAGGVHDANRPMLIPLLRRWGYDVVDLCCARDTGEAVRTALDQGAAGSDAILTTGGASAGDEDHISACLRAAGGLNIWRIAMKPGRPLALGLWRGVPVFGLPGNPVASLVCTLIFLRPALSVLAGGTWLHPATQTRPAGFSKTRKPGRREYLRARLDANGRVEAFRTEGSGIISGLSWADGLCLLPEDGPDIARDDPVTYLPYSAFGI